MNCLLAFLWVVALATLRLEGVVRDAKGIGVKGALVSAQPEWRAAWAPSIPVTARTDQLGRFSLEVKTEKAHTVRVQAEGLASQTLKKVVPGSPLTITLGKGSYIEGVLRDAQAKTPIAGARVEAREDGAAWAPGVPELGTVETTTDDKGYYRIDGLSAGLQTITGSARGFGSATKTGVRSGGRVDLFLLAGAWLVGRVVGPDGEPLAKALVRAESRSLAPSRTGGVSMATRTTDEDGRFELPGLTEGTYAVLARHKDYAPAVVSNVTVGSEGETEVKISLKQAKRLVGRLVNTSEKPVKGRIILQELSGETWAGFLDDILSADAGEDGRFTLDRVASGSHALGILAPGYARERVEIEVGDKLDVVDAGDIRLEPGVTIRGSVSDMAGLSIPGATISARNTRPIPGSFGIRIQETVSESDGSFVIGGLSPGVYEVFASASGYGSSRTSAVEAGTENLSIKLKPAGSVRGRVIDEIGKPVTAFRVSGQSIDRQSAAFVPPDTVLTTDGSFSLDVGEGTYVLRVQAPEKVPGVVSDVRVVTGASTDVGRIVLKGGGIVRGFVVDSTGVPVPGASVSLTGVELDYFTHDRSTFSDGDGAFEIQGVPEGTVGLLALHPRYASGRVRGLSVDTRQGLTEARVVLTLGGRLEGRIRARDPAALAGASVTVTSGDAITRFEEQTATSVNSEGSFVFDSLAPGRVQVMLMRREGTGTMTYSVTAAQSEVVIREGETTSVEFDLSHILVQGQLTRNSAPAPGFVVFAFGSGGVMVSVGQVSGAGGPPSGPQFQRGLTREDGSFEFLLQAPGKYSVTIHSEDGKTRLPGRVVEIPDVETFSLDLAFSGVSVSGIVVDKNTEEPVGGASVNAISKSKEVSSRGRGGATTSGVEGRFEMEIEPGEYTRASRSAGAPG